MAYPNPLDFARIPTDVLVSLDWRPYHFHLQPYHYLVRMAHIVSVSAFFGGIVLLDLHLIGIRRRLPLRSLAELVLPCVYVSFAIATVTGVALFLYDPVHVGSHAYFGPKLLLIAIGIGNAQVFGRLGYLTSPEPVMSSGAHPPIFARIAGALSLALWIAVMVCASFNVEAAPRVFLR